RVLQRQSLFRSRRISTSRAQCRRRDRADRGTVSIPDRRVRQGHRPLPKRERDRLVPGRASESGGVVPDSSSSAGTAVEPAAVVLRGSAGRGGAGGGERRG